jgi:hypothetical protein
MSIIPEDEDTDFVRGAEDFLSSNDFQQIISVVEGLRQKNQQALLATNPPNHEHDLEDGTMNLQIGEDNVAVTKKRYESLAETPFPFTIVKEGSIQEVLAFVGALEGNKQLEAAMAFYVSATNGRFLSSTDQWRKLVQTHGGQFFATIESPFYRRVCEGILDAFRERGWM